MRAGVLHFLLFPLRLGLFRKPIVLLSDATQVLSYLQVHRSLCKLPTASRLLAVVFWSHRRRTGPQGNSRTAYYHELWREGTTVGVGQTLILQSGR